MTTSDEHEIPSQVEEVLDEQVLEQPQGEAGAEVPPEGPTFVSLGLSQARQDVLAAQGITNPAPIQIVTLPALLGGEDALVHAQTGSGKTLAYLMPLFTRLDREGEPIGGIGPASPQAMVLVPTQELGMQVYNVAKKLLEGTDWLVVSLIGGANPARQAEQLRKRPRLVVGTPGRILQFIREGKLSGMKVRVVVGDEADQLFEPAHKADLDAILKATSPSRQTIFVTATPNEGSDAMPRWAAEYLRNGKILKVADELKLPPSLRHLAFVVDPREKVELVRRLVRHLNPVGAIAFVNRPTDAEWWGGKLAHHQIRAAALHSGVPKLARAATMRDFRSGKLQLLLATELAARGLDMGGVSIVFNMELPTDPWHYVHRVGRTARMGREGTAVTLVTPQEAFVLQKLEKALGIKFEHPVLDRGEIREATPRDEVKVAKRAEHEVKKQEVKAEIKAKIEAGAPVYKPKKPKKSTLTPKAIAKGKAKKAKKQAVKQVSAEWRAKRPPKDGAAPEQAPASEQP